ncbi:MAG: hypothetical protein ACK53V_05685 [Planctomycetota bacterium]
MSERKLPVITGRGSSLEPKGRFAKLEFQRDLDALDQELEDLTAKVAT